MENFLSFSLCNFLPWFAFTFCLLFIPQSVYILQVVLAVIAETSLTIDGTIIICRILQHIYTIYELVWSHLKLSLACSKVRISVCIVDGVFLTKIFCLDGYTYHDNVTNYIIIVK